MRGWEGRTSPLAAQTEQLCEAMLQSYAVNPTLIREHVGIEEQVRQGGYGQRQLIELIQNGADALESSGRRGRIVVRLTGDSLYCANEGDPLDYAGIEALLRSHISPKVGDAIGRFGQGFKSILQSTDAPLVLSRSCCLAFSVEESARRIAARVSSEGPFPVLRLARLLEPEEVAESDPVARELMEWATTVIVLPIRPEARERVKSEVRGFPAEFLLFSRQIDTLILEEAERRREISITEASQGRLLLREAEDETSWRLFSKAVPMNSLDQRARHDAGSIIKRRHSIPMHWAVPLSGRRERGEFWAFAPTEYASTVQGIFNAPWKTNNDRQNLLDGPYNRALLEVAAELVIAKLPHLATPEDPSRALDALPAKDSQGWADEQLSQSLWRELPSTSIVPNRNGELSRAEDVTLPAREAPLDALKEWESARGVASRWCHPSALRRERLSRAIRLGAKQAAVAEWLESFVEEATTANSAAAIRAAAATVAAQPSVLTIVQQARVALTESGELAAISPSRLTISAAPPPSGHRLAPDLVQSPGVAQALESLGFKEESAEELLKTYLAAPIPDWGQIWRQVRQVAAVRKFDVVVAARNGGRLCAMTLAGNFRPLPQLLLPGALFSRTDEIAKSFLVDEEFHAIDLPLMKLLRVFETPQAKSRLQAEAWCRDYANQALQTYQGEILQRFGSRPRTSSLSLSFASTDVMYGPLGPVAELAGSPAHQARYIGAILAVAEDLPPSTVKYRYPAKYPTLEVIDHPLIWLIRKHRAQLPTSLGPRGVEVAVGPGLERFEAILPVIRASSSVAERLNLPGELSALSPRHWGAAFETCWSVAPELRGEFLIEAALSGTNPDQVRCLRDGQSVEVPLGPAVVLAREGVESPAGQATLFVGSQKDAELLSSLWGLETLSAHEAELRYEAAGASEPLTAILPDAPARIASWQAQPCDVLQIRNGGDWGSPSTGIANYSRTIYFDAELGVDELRQALQESGLWDSGAPQPTLSELHGNTVQRRGFVRARRSLEERLLAAVGEAPLRKRLQGDVASSIERLRGHGLTGPDVARACLSLHGASTLKWFRGALAQRGLDPPAQWTGGRLALEFVRQLGFPEEFAGSERLRRAPFEEVWGPTPLPGLHDFQTRVVEAIRSRLNRPEPERGLLALPTGSGKTRVVIEALTQEICDGRGMGYVLWVAQTDELCEQAVQGWLAVWRARGPATRLRVHRMWGGQQTQAVRAVAPTVQIVVATYQTLSRKFAQAEAPSSWLLDPWVVVLDEAHHSVAPSYTDILERLGLTHRRTERRLIGMTATPYRGIDEVETERLANRYHAHRFDYQALGKDVDLYAELQRRRVLAQVDQELLDGADLELAPKDVEYVEHFSMLPPWVEDRLGRIEARNRSILQAVSRLDPSWPVLVFATSVRHAEILAATLAAQGILSRAISGETDRADRRIAIEGFRSGAVQVLTNYGVLATGFDAPSLRAIVVARPVWSRVLYQQMIGRGLRGPANGGKERCLILNIGDNLVNYGKQLAFRHFEHLWTVHDAGSN